MSEADDLAFFEPHNSSVSSVAEEVNDLTDAAIIVESPNQESSPVASPLSHSVTSNEDPASYAPPATATSGATTNIVQKVSSSPRLHAGSPRFGSEKELSSSILNKKFATLSSPLSSSVSASVNSGNKYATLSAPVRTRETRRTTVTAPDGKEKSFANNLRHDFRGIARHCREELQEMKSAQSVLRAYCMAELEHGRTMVKLLEGKSSSDSSNNISSTHSGSNNKLNELPPIRSQSLEEQASCLADAWGKGRWAMILATQARIKTAKELMELFLDPLDEWIKGAEITLKNAVNRQVRAKQNVDAAKENVNKNLLHCRRLIQQTKDAKEHKEQKEKEEPSSASWLMSRVSSRFSEIAGTTYDDLQKKLIASVTTYKESIDHANTLQHRYYGEDMTCLLRELQAFESERINLWTEGLCKFAGLEKQNNLPIVGIFNTYLENVSMFDATQEIPSWIDYALDRDPPPPSENDPTLTGFESYQLDVSISSIQNGRYDRNPKSPFFVNVEECVNGQLENYSRELQCPAVVIYLTQAIRSSGGLKTEGIFRLTDEKEALQALEQQLEQGNYASFPPIATPHAYAVTLKRWFKQLPDPVFPSHTAVVQYIRDLTELIDKRKAQKDDTPVTLLPSFLSSPMLKSVSHLVTLLREIAQPENSAVNRMTLQSLATMFAPCLFGSGSRDANNAKSEASALQMLFEFFPVNSASLARDLQLYEEGTTAGSIVQRPRVIDVPAVLRSLSSPEGLEYVAKVCDAPFRATQHTPSVEALDLLFQTSKPEFSAIPGPLKDQLPNLLKKYVADSAYAFGSDSVADMNMARICHAVISAGANYKTFGAMRIAFPAIAPIESIYNQLAEPTEY